ncbi:sugar nucleotide-binding protein [Thermodesulfovibrionales bacterium]|nr:sugar nucleotide-binding protein [Thermodesulfovibrionales bacterium]
MTRTLCPRIMLTGKNGQVGWELQRTLAPLGEVVALDRQRLDLADPDQIRERVREIKPSLIVNAAAYTASPDPFHQGRGKYPLKMRKNLC